VASHSERPSIDIAAGRAVLTEDLPRALRFLGVALIEDLGWRQPDARTLLIPVFGKQAGGTDEYLLRLRFLTGREWPPSAQFVNPDTLDYRIPDDSHHLPQLGTSEVHVHPSYASPHSGPIQLICCSATFEYYDVLHGGEERHLWKTTDTFLVTISAIERAMGTGYQGRQPRHAG
jgi:hypothetical protein